MSKRVVWAVVVGLLLLTVGIYGRTVTFDFVNYDDPKYVYDNERILAGLSNDGVKWAFTNRQFTMWHPLVLISLMADAEFYGARAGGYHATNLALHAANVVLLFTVLRVMTGAVWRSALVAALFAAHPLHVESVAWVTERKDVLSTLFWLSAMLAYAGYARVGGVGRYLVVAALFAAGLLSKSMLVTLPLALLLLDVWPLGRLKLPGAEPHGDVVTPPSGTFPRQSAWRLVAEKLPLLALSGLFSVISLRTQTASMASLDLTFAQRLANAATAYLVYLRKMVWPSDLAYFYPFRVVDPFRAIVAALILAAVTAAVLYCARRRPYLAVGWFWYVGTLVPVIGLVQVGDQAYADRYTYVPLIGIYIALAWSAAALVAARPRARTAVVAASVAIVAAAAIVAWAQVGYWRDSRTMWQHAIDVVPDCYMGHRGLAIVYMGDRRYDLAIEELNRALRIRPRSPVLHLGLAILYAQQGKLDEAAEACRATLEIKPDYFDAQLRLADIYQEQGALAEAADAYRRALELDPLSHEAHASLGKMLAQLGDLAGAAAEYERAIALDSHDARTLFNLGMLMAGQGRLNDAARCFDDALRISPGLWQAASRLALLRASAPDASLRNGAEAVRLAQQAAQATGFKDPRVLATLAAAHAENGDFAAAVGTQQLAMQRAPERERAAYRARLEQYQAGRPYRARPRP